MRIDGYEFIYICRIQPEMDDHNKVRIFRPQDRYAKASQLSLHSGGDVPFCKFRIPGEHRMPGVYLLTVNYNEKYIGECRNLAKRYNSGYGQISPRNCFIGGRLTNCRINSLIFETVAGGNSVDLWLLETENYKEVEKKLILLRKPCWNRKGI